MITGFHFVEKTLRYWRPVQRDGEWLEHDGPIVLCRSGLHASLHPFDALEYAPGDTLCLVTLDGDIQHGEDKVVASRRRIDRRIDATELLRSFARTCAMDVIDLWEVPEVVRQYLATGDETIRRAAKDVAWSDEYDAARAAARDAACGAAMDAAWYAARAAARDAAWHAGWQSAFSASRERQRDRFADMVRAAFTS